MNMLLKSIFVMVYMMGANAIFMYSAYQLFVGGITASWSGVLLATLPGAAFFNFVTMTKSMARTSRNMHTITALTVIGAVIAVTSWAVQQQEQQLQMMLGLGGLIGWLLYNFWYSRYGERDTSMLEVGMKLPEFTLKNLTGATVSSGDFAGKPAIFLFYRGNWCPLCMAQIKEIANEYHSLSRRGVQIILVSPQSHDHTQKLAEKFDVPFVFMIDEGNKAAEKLNIISRNGLPVGMQAMGYDSDTVMPTVVITGADEKILFADLTDNYRVRPEPITFTRVLDAYLSGRTSINSALTEEG